MVATYYVSADGKTIDVEWYSPIQKAYYLEEGQFTFTTESTKFPRVVASVEGGNGTVSPERIDAGDDPVTVVFTPEVGYAVEKVTLNGVDVTDQVRHNKLVIDKVEGHTEVVVSYYSLGAYPIEVVNDDQKGTTNLSISTDGVHALGTTATFSVMPKGENTVKAVKYNGHTITATGGVYNITIKAVENIIEVIYNDIIVINYYTLTVQNDTAKGTVTPQDPFKQNYEVGEQVSFTITTKGDNSVKAVKYNGHTITATGGVYNITIKAVENIIEVIYNEIIVPEPPRYYALSVVNDDEKGAITPLWPFSDSYKEGTEVIFEVTPNGENTVKAVKFNGHTLTASDGKYTAKIVATDNIIEVVYDEVAVAPPPPSSSNSCSTTSSLWAIVSAVLFCGLFLIKG